MIKVGSRRGWSTSANSGVDFGTFLLGNHPFCLWPVHYDTQTMDRYSDTLLDDEAVNEDGLLNGTESGEHSRADPHANLPVYRTIHR